MSRRKRLLNFDQLQPVDIVAITAGIICGLAILLAYIL